jgi:hypothetical protein
MFHTLNSLQNEASLREYKENKPFGDLSTDGEYNAKMDFKGNRVWIEFS